jgi:hypothetical protein
MQAEVLSDGEVQTVAAGFSSTSPCPLDSW